MSFYKVEQHRRLTEVVYSIDFIRGEKYEHDALLAMERALPEGSEVLFYGITVVRPPVDYGDGIVLPGPAYYRMNVRVNLQETHA